MNSESDQAERHISVHTPQNLCCKCCLNMMLQQAQVHKIALYSRNV